MKKNQKRLIVLGLASMSLVLAACQSGENSSTSSSTSTSSDTIDDTPVIPTPTNASIRLVSPEEGASFSITPEAISTYLNADTEAKQIEAIAKAKLAENKDLTSSPVRLTWQKDGSAYYTVSLADNPSFENAVQAKVSSLSTSYEANNLIPNSTYYWKVKGTRANDESKVQTFKTTGASVRFISAPGAYNIRDLGGWKAGSKTLPYGKLFRGSLLNNFNGYADLNEAGKETFNNTLGIQTEIDLRQPEKDDGNQSECFFDPSKKYVKAQLGQYNRILDPENFAATYDQNSYGAMVTSTDKSLSNAAYTNDGITVRSLRDIFAVLSDESNYPVYFHCNAGADRTGTLAFLIEGLLGVSYADTIRDFEL
ncbi:MAG: tyrosine-protein phosphatase, partial [Candidatus Enteromonas sp.]